VSNVQKPDLKPVAFVSKTAIRNESSNSCRLQTTAFASLTVSSVTVSSLFC